MRLNTYSIKQPSHQDFSFKYQRNMAHSEIRPILCVIQIKLNRLTLATQRIIKHIWFWYLSQFQEMKGHVSQCKCVDSPEPLLPAYTKYRCRPELRQLALLCQHGQLMLALPICDKNQTLTSWSILHLSTLYIT